MAGSSDFCNIEWAGEPCRIEYSWVGHSVGTRPLMVFLHEGLGSHAMWRDFPDTLCKELGWQGLVYSRPGYGRSTPRRKEVRWTSNFLERQAVEVLPSLLNTLGVSEACRDIWLFGHSDGGSIALLHAAAFPAKVAGVIVLAPHIMVEQMTVESIQKAREAFLSTNLRSRLARYHDDPDSAFWGWNDVWLSPDFRTWNIQAELTTIRCPVLAMQGVRDEYGSMEQIRGIQKAVPAAQLLEIESCGHSAHKDCPEHVIAKVKEFTARSALRS